MSSSWILGFCIEKIKSQGYFPWNQGGSLRYYGHISFHIAIIAIWEFDNKKCLHLPLSPPIWVRESQSQRPFSKNSGRTIIYKNEQLMKIMNLCPWTTCNSHHIHKLAHLYFWYTEGNAFIRENVFARTRAAAGGQHDLCSVSHSLSLSKQVVLLGCITMYQLLLLTFTRK